MSSRELLFTEPSNPDMRIWRYMDFAKFVSMLDKGGLYFPTIAELKKADPLEGTLPYNISRTRDKYHAEAAIELYKSDPDLSKQIDLIGEKSIGETVVAFNSLVLDEAGPKWIGVNCWHMNDDESLAMWKLYSKSNGIAIQSTFKRLRECLNETISIKKVQYLDFNPQANENLSYSGPYNLHIHALNKSRWHTYEQEIRAIKSFLPEEFNHNSSMMDLMPKLLNGLSAEELEAVQWEAVSLEQLIENVYLAPSEPSWFQTLVKNVLSQYRYNNIPVKLSTIAIPNGS